MLCHFAKISIDLPLGVCHIMSVVIKHVKCQKSDNEIENLVYTKPDTLEDPTGFWRYSTEGQYRL